MKLTIKLERAKGKSDFFLMYRGINSHSSSMEISVNLKLYAEEIE